MKLKKLHSHESLITEISPEVCDLAYFLGIAVNIHDLADHLFISNLYTVLKLESYDIRRVSDVAVNSKIFCEILMDTTSGMSVIDAYNKQGYTF